MGYVQNHINHCFQLVSVKAPIQVTSSAPRKILMHEREAEYHERPKEESPSQDLIVAGCVWSPLLLPGKPSLSTLCY